MTVVHAVHISMLYLSLGNFSLPHHILKCLQTCTFSIYFHCICLCLCTGDYSMDEKTHPANEARRIFGCGAVADPIPNFFLSSKWLLWFKTFLAGHHCWSNEFTSGYDFAFELGQMKIKPTKFKWAIYTRFLSRSTLSRLLFSIFPLLNTRTGDMKVRMTDLLCSFSGQLQHFMETQFECTFFWTTLKCTLHTA